MKKQVKESPLSIKCGKNSYSYEKIQKIAEQKANEVKETIVLEEGATKEVAFWTDDIVAELICVGIFKKENGSVSFDLDFAQGTL